MVRPETLRLMRTAEGAAVNMSAQDPKMHYGLALTLNHEDDHRSVGQHGSLLGYSGSLYEFPEDRLTIVVLTNTEGQNAYAISRALARAILGLPELPKPPESRPPVTLADKSVSAAEIRQLTGPFVLTAHEGETFTFRRNERYYGGVPRMRNLRVAHAPGHVQP